MKKIILFSGLLSLLAITSCKKDYTCACTGTSNGVQTHYSESIVNASKKKAAESCDAGDNTVTSGGITTVTDCVIK